MGATGQVTITSGPLTVTAYPGDNAVLIAMSLADGAVDTQSKNLAGFAIYRKVGGAAEIAIPNRLNFTAAVTKDTTPEEREWTPSDQAPFQKFRWVDVLAQDFTSAITYRVVAKYFSGGGPAMTDGPSASVTVQPPGPAHGNFSVAFTRGYASSQAYVDKFQNKDIRPKKKTADFDTKPYVPQYVWLGADARKHLFDFIAECDADRTAKIDILVYDIDEPDVIKAFCGWGTEGRLRAILDNAPLHTKAGAVEIDVAKMLKAAAGAANVKQGHFSRFQHNKVIVKRDASGKAQKVLFGSMNFSLRGLYIQANNIMVADDATTAGYFADAFDAAWAGDVQTGAFTKAAIAQGYNTISAADSAALPQSSVALSPHKDDAISLGPVSDAIRAAKSSVLFAVMAPSGGGSVLDSLRVIAGAPTIFSYGTVETATGLAVQNADGQMGDVTPFAFLKDKVPEPFKKEWNGGPGMHIHHKFIVVDFNDAKPLVFTGSSNLAAGGEKANGDNLIQIHDPVIAGLYMIEAVKLFDHYSFRKHMAAATVVKPLCLWYPAMPGAGAPWWKAYYDKTSIRLRDRYMFADLPLPAGVAAVKSVDWSAIPKGPAKAGGTPAKKKAAKPKTAKKAATKTVKKKAKKKTPARKAVKKITKKKVGKKAARKTKKARR
ncbi:MAG: phospholipase D-like domain-containing protein [Rhizomicrobium sp.]